MFLCVNIIFFTFSASFYDQLKLERVMSKPLYLDIESSLVRYSTICHVDNNNGNVSNVHRQKDCHNFLILSVRRKDVLMFSLYYTL